MMSISCSEQQDVPPQDTVTITGSESEMPLAIMLADEYKKTHPGMLFSITGGGTDAGIDALLKGKTDIANASRIMSSEEYDVARAAGIEISQLIIAQDAIDIITHPSVGVEFITVEDLAGIYSGKIRNWKELGGADLDIYPVGRKSGSGTRSYMLHRLDLPSFCIQTMEFETYEDIINTVSTTRGAIGYVSNRFIHYGNGSINSSVWVMNVSLNGMPYASPLNQDDLTYGEYPLMRPLFQYYVSITPSQQQFLQYELSDEGQSILDRSGYIALSGNQREINRRKAASLPLDSLTEASAVK